MFKTIFYSLFCKYINQVILSYLTMLTTSCARVVHLEYNFL